MQKSASTVAEKMHASDKIDESKTKTVNAVTVPQWRKHCASRGPSQSRPSIIDRQSAAKIKFKARATEKIHS